MIRRSADVRATVPLVEERAVVLKRKKVTGAVRVRTRVREDEETIDEPLHHEEIAVERVPADRWVEAAVPVRQEGDTTIYHVLEEVLVIEKRLLLKEEIHVTRTRTETREPVTVSLRSDEAAVERFDAFTENT